MTTTLLIVPAFSDQAGQCRIVARDGSTADCLKSYRSAPDEWREVGLMDSRGNVRCIERQFDALRDDVPLMAGNTYVFND